MRKRTHVEVTKKIDNPIREDVFQIMNPIARPEDNPATAAMGIEVAG
jgi:hypothetical protein